MASVFGKNLIVSLFGESHNKTMGITINNLLAGIKLDLEFIDKKLGERRPNELGTLRKEKDHYEIISGFFNGFTTGAPLTFLVYNEDIDSTEYEENKLKPRPGHADFAAYIKYQGFHDYRGSGHFSGRITVLLVILGAICEQILNNKKIEIISHIKSIHNINDTSMNDLEIEQYKNFSDEKFPVYSIDAKKKMVETIKKAKDTKDSVGGVVETAVLGIEIGVGEPFFNSVEAIVSHLLFSIPSVKGVSFGDGFEITKKFGSEIQDSLYFDGKIKTKENHNGGINGGITNGMPIIIQTAIKAPASIGKPLETLNLHSFKKEVLNLQGRHDPCIVPRVIPVIDSMVAFALVDLYMDIYGQDWMKK